MVMLGGGMRLSFRTKDRGKRLSNVPPIIEVMTKARIIPNPVPTSVLKFNGKPNQCARMDIAVPQTIIIKKNPR